jgi:hypothetical protein
MTPSRQRRGFPGCGAYAHAERKLLPVAQGLHIALHLGYFACDTFVIWNVACYGYGARPYRRTTIAWKNHYLPKQR